MKTPMIFPMTAFTRAMASLPPACVVIRTLDEMVVGVAQAMMRPNARFSLKTGERRRRVATP